MGTIYNWEYQIGVQFGVNLDNEEESKRQMCMYAEVLWEMLEKRLLDGYELKSDLLITVFEKLEYSEDGYMSSIRLLVKIHRE